MKALALGSRLQRSRTTPDARFIVWPHHSDMWRRPSPTWGPAAALSQALTWNVFRTLELTPPPFWLRRFNACLALDLPLPASTTACVKIWHQLYAPPFASDARRPPVDVDVLIETEHAVWAVLVCHAGDLLPDSDALGPDPLVMTAYAASWYAGRRDCYVALVVPALDNAPVAQALCRRYRASATAMRLRMPPRGHDVDNVRGVGIASWSQVACILRDVAAAQTIDAVERSLAHRTAEWCASVNV